MKAKGLFLFFTCLMLAISASGQSSGNTGTLYWALSADGTLTIQGTGSMPDYSSAFTPWMGHRDNIKKVDIKEGVTTIGISAFYKCSNLTSVIIPGSIKSIQSGAFNSCSALSSITIPEGVNFILGNVFKFCDNLTNIEVSASNANYSSENGILYNKDKTALVTYPKGKPQTSFSIPVGVKNIGIDAFLSCENLTSITIPNSVTGIENAAFEFCGNLSSIIIPNSVTSIGSSAFEYCSGLTSVTLPAEAHIGNYAFEYCSSLTSVTIPAGVTMNYSSIFQGCSGLTSVIISEGVTGIGYATFRNCTALAEVTIPASVTTIGEDAFYGCKGLKRVKVKWQTPLQLSSNTIIYGQGATLIVPDGTKKLYEVTRPWDTFTTIIEESQDVSQTAIPAIQAETQARISGNILFLNTPVQETVSIYSLSGKLLHSTIKPAGEAQIPLEGIREKILIVQCGAGKAKKLVRP